MAERNTLVVRKRIAGIFWRARRLFVYSAVFFIVQVISADQYQQKALNQRMRPVMIDAKRGTIYDRTEETDHQRQHRCPLRCATGNRKPQRTCQAVGANYRFEEGEIFKN